MRIVHRPDGSNRIRTRRKVELVGNHASAPIHKRRRKSLAAVSLAVLMLGGAAAAAFLAEGQGTTTSTETTGSAGSAPVTLTASNLTDALTPGGPAGQIDIDLSNPCADSGGVGCQLVQVSNVVVAVTGTSAGATCAGSNFTVTQPTFGFHNNPDSFPVVLGDMTNGAGNGPVSLDTGSAGGTDATIALNASAPSGCESVTVNLSETAS